jgi:tight adherence protein B
VRRFFLVTLAGVAALVLSGAAAAGVQLKGLDASAYPTLRLSVVTDTASSRPPRVTENGHGVAGEQADTLAHAASVVLAVDRSRSMQGQSLSDATAGALSFVAAKPQGNRIAVVGFGDHAIELARFSSATIDADSVLRSLSVDSRQGTALYDAVVLSANALDAEDSPGRVIILLTDGKDVSSTHTLEQSIDAARSAGAAVYPIGIASPDSTAAPLRELAKATGGTYHRAASSAALSQIYGTIAAELARTWRVEYVTAARPGDRLRIQASVRGSGTATSALSIPSLGNGPAADAPSPSPVIPRALLRSPLGSFILALAVGLDIFGAFVFFRAARRGSWLKNRLAPHVSAARGDAKLTQERERFALAGGLFRATENAFGNLRQWHSAQRLIERADLPLRTVELLYIMLVSGFFLGLVAAMAAFPPPVILVAMAIGWLVPYFFVWFKAKRRLRAFENQLPDLLITLAASLKAGHSFRQGINTVVEEGQDPASGEFKRVLTNTSLGRPMDDALAEMAQRVGSTNFEFAITAVTIQRQVGGSLAGLFDMVAETVRQRQQFARKIRSLTAMGRMSAYVLVGLPFFMATALTVVNSTYMSPLYHTPTGHILIAIGLGMMGFGSLILKKIVSFRG